MQEWLTHTHTPHTQQINFSLLLRCLGTKSCLTLWKAPWTIACQAPLSMGFPRRVAISFSRGSSWPRDQTWLSYISGGFFTVWATRGAPIYEEFEVNLEALKTPGVQIHRAKNWGDKGCSLLCVNVLPTKYTCRGELFRRSLCLEGKKIFIEILKTQETSKASEITSVGRKRIQTSWWNCH